MLTQRLYAGDTLTLGAKCCNPMNDPIDIPRSGAFEVLGRMVKVWKGEEF